MCLKGLADVVADFHDTRLLLLLSLSLRFIWLDHGLYSFTADRTENVLSIILLRQANDFCHYFMFARIERTLKRVKVRVRERKRIEMKKMKMYTK